MKKLTLTLGIALLALLSLDVNAQSENAPVINFETEEIDYGTIEQGSNGEREFVFVNNGKEPLVINSAKGSCGCTVPTWPREPIAPGDKAVIKVKYDTNRLNSFQKTVTIKSNAKNSPSVLRIKGKVIKPEQEQTSPVKDDNTSAPRAQ